MSLSVGGSHSCVTLSNRQLKCWGYNLYGQLGLGDTNHRGDGANEMGAHLPAIDLGTVDGTNSGTPLTAKSVSAGVHHTCAILSNDQLKCWGHNLYGQLGLGDENHRGDAANEMGNSLPPVDLGTGVTAKVVVAAYGHTCAILSNDQLKCWGSNGHGQLGWPHDGFIIELNTGNSANEMGDNLLPINLGTEDGTDASTPLTVKSIALGDFHTCAILSNDRVKCWGSNKYGQIGMGPVRSVGDGLEDELGNNLLPVDLGTEDGTGTGTPLTAKAITAGNDHTCVILSNDRVKCWGNNQYGQVGLGDTSSPKNRIGDQDNEMGNHLSLVDLGTIDGTNTGTPLTTKAIMARGEHVCTILSNDQVKCWGYNRSAQLGLGDINNRGDRVGGMGSNLLPIGLGEDLIVKAIGAGGEHNCALLQSEQVKCWGDNAFGQLGMEEETAEYFNLYIGDQIEEMGGNLAVIRLE